jgi:hypothetical protein
MFYNVYTMSELHPPCSFVAKEIGDGLDADPSILDEHPEVVSDIIDQITAAHVRSADELDLHSFRPGARAVQELGCATCQIAETCNVKAVLGQYGARDWVATAVVEAALDFNNSPYWLTRAREQRTGYPAEELKRSTLLEPGYLEAAARHFNGQIHFVHSGIRIVGSEQVTERDLTEVTTTLLVSSLGHRFTVVDASNEVGFKEQPLPHPEYDILAAKFLGRLVEVGPDGQPQILSCDNIMQKCIRILKTGMLCELRMGGKNRWYFTVRHSPETDLEEEFTQIVILGSHGGDAVTQSKFIKHIFAKYNLS